MREPYAVRSSRPDGYGYGGTKKSRYGSYGNSSTCLRLSGDYVQDPVTEVTRTRALPPTALSISENRAARLSVHPTVPPGWRPESLGDAHIVFGSERVTDPFVNNARV